jgi:S-adenosylmethionine decarboxylase
MAFGYELLLDLYQVDKGVCDDLDLCYRFLDEVVPHLGLQKQSPPFIFRSDDQKFPDKAGLSGWVPLIESSVVIHTLSVRDFISIDIYCCRKFDTDKAIEFTSAFFHPKKIDSQFLERGSTY